MAPAGLKPGDTFVDHGRTYQVDKVNPDGSYCSHYVEQPKKTRRTKA